MPGDYSFTGSYIDNSNSRCLLSAKFFQFSFISVYYASTFSTAGLLRGFEKSTEKDSFHKDNYGNLTMRMSPGLGTHRSWSWDEDQRNDDQAYDYLL